MRKGTKIISTLLIAAVVLTIGFSGREFFKGEPVMAKTEVSNENVITVRGEGTIKVKPDIAYITMGVRTENKDAKIAQTNNAEKMDSVIAALKNMGIEEKDIQTSNYSIYPQYDYESKNGEKIIGYTVNNSVKITVRDILKVGSVFDIGIEQGANVSNGIQFSVSNTEKYYHEALKQAVNNAKGKADALAGAIGVTITNPITVVEQSSGGSFIGYGAADMLQSAKSSRTPIEAGELDIYAAVEVSYKY